MHVGLGLTEWMGCLHQVVIEMVPSVKMLRNTGHMTGHVALRLANLAARGFMVIPIACARWRSLEVGGAAAVDGNDSRPLTARHPFASVEDAREQFLVQLLGPHLPHLRERHHHAARPNSPHAPMPGAQKARRLPAVRKPDVHVREPAA